MTPAELITAVRAAGATLQPEGAFVRVAGLAALPGELRAALRQHRDQVHVLICAEAAVLAEDQHDLIMRAELADTSPRPGSGYRPGDPDPLRDGLLRAFRASRSTSP
jgi:hypothetical protein